MRVRATSQFHGPTISATFNLSEGVNIRKITKKNNPCSGEHGTCGCGWPFTRTDRNIGGMIENDDAEIL